MRTTFFLWGTLLLAACSENRAEGTAPQGEIVTTLTGGIGPSDASAVTDGRTRITIVNGTDGHKQVLWDTANTGGKYGPDFIYVRSDRMTSGYAAFVVTSTSDDRLSATFGYQAASSLAPVEAGFSELFAGMFTGALAVVPYDSDGTMWMNLISDPAHTDDGTIDKELFPLVGYAQGADNTALHFRAPFGVLHIVLTAGASDPVKVRQTSLAIDPAVMPDAYLKGGMMVNARDAVSASGNFTFRFAASSSAAERSVTQLQDNSYLLPTDMEHVSYRFIMPAGDYPADALQFTVWQDNGSGGLGAAKTWSLGNALTVESSHTYTLPPLTLTSSMF